MNILSAIIVLFGADFPICTATSYQGHASVKCLNDTFYVFYADQRQYPPFRSVYCNRVTASGTVLDGSGVDLHSDSAGISVNAAFDGTNFLIVTVDPSC